MKTMNIDCFVGIDLGSTTTKAIFVDKAGRILGRGITNSRSNYHTACEIAKEEGMTNTRFRMLKDGLEKRLGDGTQVEKMMAWLTSKFGLGLHLLQLKALGSECATIVNQSLWAESEKALYGSAIERIFSILEKTSDGLFVPGVAAQSDFFRDLATTQFLKQSEAEVKKDPQLSFDRLIGLFDKAIIIVENKSFTSTFSDHMEFASRKTITEPTFKQYSQIITEVVRETIALQINILSTVGTGYGRLTLPFPKDQIRSEILCHGLGAHAMFPDTRTVLDIGGQDTKAIQIDGNGIVTSFQMNDRCAAGCGRYLGYIADEMNMGVHQLGPLAMQSSRPARINSTCTVFAGAELRERLALGEKREDILSGLHRAIILRAMALLARSGGVISQFTFTGGVAKNEAAVRALKDLIKDNYGDVAMNISADSIFTGALGASLYALRDQVQ